MAVVELLFVNVIKRQGDTTVNLGLLLSSEVVS